MHLHSGPVDTRIKNAFVQGAPMWIRTSPASVDTESGIEASSSSNQASATVTLRVPSHLQSRPIHVLAMNRCSQFRGALCAPAWEAVPHMIPSLHGSSMSRTVSRAELKVSHQNLSMQLARAGEPRNGSGKLPISGLLHFQLAKDARQALRQGIVPSLTISSRESLADDHQCKVGGYLVHMGRRMSSVMIMAMSPTKQSHACKTGIGWLGSMTG
jgi:hypothetical protein